MKHTTFEQVVKIDRTTASEEECATLPYVGLEHIDKDTGHLINGFTGDAEILLATKFKFTHKHVLYGKLRPYLNKVAMPAFTGICTTEILPLLPREGCIDRTYLWALLQSPSFINWASSSVSGANLPRLDPKLLAEYRLSLPPLPEQKRIATILEKADHLRRLRRYTLKLSDTYLQSVFLEMFGDPVTNPNNYKVVRLSEQIDLVGGYAFKSDDFTNFGIPLVRIGTVNTGTFDESNLVYLPEAFTKTYGRFLLNPRDLVITLTGTVGKDDYANMYMLGRHFRKYFLNQRVAKIVINPHTFTSEYILHAFKQPSIKRILTNPSRGIRQANISNEDILSLIIPLPSLQLQQKFSQIVHVFERVQVQQREAARQAEHLFQTLLHQAFQGELTSDVEDMPDVAVETMRYQALVADDVDMKAYQVALPME